MTATLSLDPRGRVIAHTNLCLNPYAVKAYVGYGTQNITPNVAATTNPDGLTQANAVTYSSSSPMPGVILAAGLPAGTYTVSAWVNFVSASPTAVAAFAVVGSAVQPSPPPPAIATWVRRSWTTVVPAGASLGFRLSTVGGAGGEFRITGVLVEHSPTLTNFFGGESLNWSDNIFAWTGVQDASTSTWSTYDPDTASTAIFALGYHVQRPVRTIVHDVPFAATQPVTFKPAGLRSGTIQYLFADRDACRRAEIIHSRAGYITLTDPDWPDQPMRYVPTGTVSTDLDDETRVRWILETGFQEI